MYHQYQLQQIVLRSPTVPETPSTALITDRGDKNNTNIFAPSVSSSPDHWTAAIGSEQNVKIPPAFARLRSFTESSFSSVTLPPLGANDATDDDALASPSPRRPKPTPVTDEESHGGNNGDGNESSPNTISESRRSSYDSKTPRHTDEMESEADETKADDELPRFVPMQAARAHWMQLHKQNIQLSVLQRMFLRLFQRHMSLRPLWPFARCFDVNKQNMDELLTSAAFQHFCVAYQTSLTLIMDNLDEEPSLCQILQDLGANHFFYDVNETHFKVMREEFLLALEECVTGTADELNNKLKQDWEQLWAKMESNLAFGLAVQRHNYLAHCMTGTEMDTLRTQWHTLLGAKCQMDALGTEIRERGIQTFLDGLNHIGQEIGEKDEIGQKFAMAVNELLWAMAQAITLWEPGTGFLRLCAEIDSRCNGAFDAIRTSSSTLLRKAFIEGFSAKFVAVLGENEANATALHSWTKVYRVAEQAIIADGMDNERSGHF